MGVSTWHSVVVADWCCFVCWQVMWELNNVSLVPSAKYLFLRNGSLVVMETDLEDMGDYVCVVDAVSLTRTLRLVGACSLPTQP